MPEDYNILIGKETMAINLPSNVAVIMSLYKNDDASFFKEAVNSILNQSVFCDLIIYRDGLVTPQLERELIFFEGLDNVYVIRNDVNFGLANGLNVMINYCLVKKYSYIARMDSDDISMPDRIKSQLEYFQCHNNVSVIGTFCEEFGSSFALELKSLPTKHEEMKNFSISRCPFIHPTVMFRSDVFSFDSIRYPENTKLTEDMALWFILLEQGFIFGNVPRPLLKYRLCEDTVARRKGRGKAVSEFKMRFRYMLKFNLFTLKNSLLVFSRLLFHILPEFFLKVLYKYYR